MALYVIKNVNGEYCTKQGKHAGPETFSRHIEHAHFFKTKACAASWWFRPEWNMVQVLVTEAPENYQVSGKPMAWYHEPGRCTPNTPSGGMGGRL